MKSNENKIEFPALIGKKVEVEFVNETITSDGGVILLREMDTQLGLTSQLADVIPEYRNTARVEHSIDSMIKQRVIGLALGYEDLNDHNELRNDPAIQTASGKIRKLASPSTLCRLEQTASRQICIALSEIMVEQFVNSFSTPPTELILDADPTDDETHGNQENSHFNGYYHHNCFLPLHIFCDSQLLISYLRPSNIDGAKHVWAILSLLVKRFRQSWPDVRIIFRADSGLCRQKMFNWCEKNNVYYITGIAGNSVLLKKVKGLIARAERDYEKTGSKARLFDQIYYAAKTWKKQRKIIVKAEHGALGPNARFIVTNIDFITDAWPQIYYDDWYCLRGNMENKIKELKLDLNSDRTSCHSWWPNQFRLLLTSCAYILMDSLRRIALKNTELKNSTVGTIRLKLLKIGAIIKRSQKRIKFLLTENFPRKNIFYKASSTLRAT